MKKTLFILENSEDCQKCLDFLGNRKDINILNLNENNVLVKEYQILSAPTLVVEDWEEVLVFRTLKDIENFLSNEPTPNYPCVCSE